MASSKPIVLITGANQGIGFTLAHTLARDHGYHVLLGSRNKERGAKAATQLQEEGSSVEPITLDLTSDSSILAAAKEVEVKHGRLDVLVNNAGILLDDDWEPGDLQGMMKFYRDTFETNLFGTAAVTEAFVSLLEKAKIPRLVFLSSMLGSLSDRNDPSSIYDAVESVSYRCSKAAINMLCLSYARRYRDKGWKVNTCCPGYVITNINKGGGVLTVEEAMLNLVRLCTLGVNGETGTFSDNTGPIPW
ncbi:NAD(P)-binding protein [Zopfia rhizophila CBS 207.26]|uniref:NAD(P)-binding protein n=1 Tax=Zopfia rhizophila CBS 207.26 TaxID=1314779 RepID=A0A6A6D6K1_9PEZI|nr:NAD(P)-binding protein [Zopfia rhizophila CBS 207.26]